MIHPERMRRHLSRRRYDRTARLFACACARRFWHLLGERSRQLVETAERFADGAARARELLNVIQASYRESGLVHMPGASAGRANRRERAGVRARLLAAEAARAAAGYTGYCAALRVLRPTVGAAKRDFRPPTLPGRAVREEEMVQAQLLRDVIGNPFHPMPETPFAVSADARALAAAIYQDRSFGDLSLLAGSLEAAGCTESELLGHLRGPGPHIRGCWALDLALGKD
jgi:hypothetical protein